MRYDVTITPLPTMALFDLKGRAEALRDWAGAALPPLPDRPNSACGDGQGMLMWLGPEHWVLRADLDREAALEATLRPAEAPPDLSIVRVSDTLAFFRITGPEAEAVLAIACPLDLHPSRFGSDGASFTRAFGVPALVAQCTEGFDLAVARSYAPMLTRALAEAVG